MSNLVAHPHLVHTAALQRRPLVSVLTPTTHMHSHQRELDQLLTVVCRKQLKARFLMNTESQDGLVEDIAGQVGGSNGCGLL